MGMKWSFLPPMDGGQRYLAVNADESEPATFKDQVLIEFDPHQLVEGVAICMKACQLDTAFIYIRGEYHHHRVILEKAIQEAGRSSEMWIMGGAGMKEIVRRVMDKDPLYPADITYPPAMIAAGIDVAVAHLRESAL